MLLFAGFSLFIDSERILLSRLVGASSDILLNLPHPFFYYVALGLAVAGLSAIFASFIGWWATCLKSYCVLSIVGGDCFCSFALLFCLRVKKLQIFLCRAVFFSCALIAAD